MVLSFFSDVLRDEPILGNVADTCGEYRLKGCHLSVDEHLKMKDCTILTFPCLCMRHRSDTPLSLIQLEKQYVSISV